MSATHENVRRPRLLLFEQRMIGDAVMSLPFLRSAETVYEVHVTCALHSAGIFKLALPEDRIIDWTPPWITEGRGAARWKNAGWGDYLRKVRSVRADVAASVWADSRVHLLMAASGARVRAGFPMTRNNFYASHLPWRRKQIKIGAVINGVGTILALRTLLSLKINRGDYYQHHVEDFRDLAGALRIPWDETRPWLPMPPAQPREQPVWLIHPGARFKGRQWPVELFGRIASEVLLPAGVKVLFIKPPEISEPLPPLPDAVQVLEPASLAEFMKLCAGADVLLCNDTGVSHMGAALGKQVVSIFSDQEPRWFAPRGSEALAVWRDVCPHRPCLDHCVMPAYICLEAVRYEMVRDRVKEVLRGATRLSWTQ